MQFFFPFVIVLTCSVIGISENISIDYFFVVKSREKTGMWKPLGGANVSSTPKDSQPGNYLRNSQVARFYKILILLETSRAGFSVRELKDSLEERGLEVTERTIYRDLEGLRQAGFPIITKDHDQPGGKKFLLDKSLSVNNYLLFTIDEIFALHIAQISLSSLERTPFYADVKSIFAKIIGKINTKSKDYLHELQNEFHFDQNEKWALGINEKVLAILRKACHERQLVRMTYKSSQEDHAKERKVGPDFLYLTDGCIYLVARAVKSIEVKLYSLTRIQSVELLNDQNPNEELSKEQFIKGTFRSGYNRDQKKIVVRFDKEIADFVKERRWHSSQKSEPQADGTIVVSFQLGISRELVRWVVGFGSQAEVIEPKELRDMILEEAKKIVKNYK